jgi:hypothetical protein
MGRMLYVGCLVLSLLSGCASITRFSPGDCMGSIDPEFGPNDVWRVVRVGDFSYFTVHPLRDEQFGHRLNIGFIDENQYTKVECPK